MDNEIKVTEQEINDDERIDKFLRGKMSDADAQLFLSDIESNQELEGKAITMARLIKAMDNVGKLSDAETIGSLKSISEEEFMAIANISKKNTTKAIPLWRKRSTIMSIAASILLVLMVGGGYQYVDYRHTQSLADTYAMSFDSQAYLRGEANTDVANELSALYQNVNDGKNIETTISRLKELWELSKKDTYNDYTNYSDEIGYELAIAYLRDNDKDAAKHVLQSLCKGVDAESTIVMNANKLIKKM